MPAYQDQRRVAFSSIFNRQTTQGTALVNGLLDMSFTANRVTVTRVPAYKIFRDCSTLYMRRRQILSRFYRITLEFDASPHLFAGFLAGAMGIAAAPTGTDPKTHAITMLGPSGRELFYHTFIVGHEDGSGEAYKYKDVAINTVRAQASAGQDTTWRGTVDMVASGNRTSVTGYTFPICVDEDPAKLYDGTFVINAVDYIASTKSIVCEYSNNIFTNDAPFTAGSLDVKRWLYGNDNRTYLLGGAILSVDRPGDTLAALAYANTDVGTDVLNTSMRIGTATNGVTINIPKADVTAEDAGQGYAGEAGEAVLNILMAAKKVAGDANSPMAATAIIPLAQQGVAFEVAA